MRLPSLFIVLLLAVAPFSDAYARLLISTTVPAQAWLVDRLAGDTVDIVTLIPVGHVAETAQPGPRKLARAREADLQFVVGHPSFFFESRYFSTKGDGSRTDRRLPIRINMYQIANNMAPPRLLEGSDPHLWTSISIMHAVAKVLLDALVSLDPAAADKYRSNYLTFSSEIKKLNDQMQIKLSANNVRKLLVYHPAWGHFCEDFEIQQIAVEHEGKVPGPGSISRLLEIAGSYNLRYIISSPGSEQRMAMVIAEQLQIKVLAINPMDKDWLVMMQSMINAMGSND